MESLKEYAESGGKILAECGGMVFLGRTLKSKENGTAYAMSNILPIDFIMPTVLKPYSGYRKASSPDWELKGAEFHYSTILKDDTPDTGWAASPITNWKGVETDNSKDANITSPAELPRGLFYRNAPRYFIALGIIHKNREPPDRFFSSVRSKILLFY